MATEQVNIRLALQGAAQVTAGLKGIQSAFTALRTSIPAVIALGVISQLANAVQAAIDMADAAGKMAEKTGIAVESLTALQYAARLSEVSNEALQTSLKKFSEEMVKGGRASADVLDELLRVSDEFAQMEDGAYKTARAVELFGRSGQTMIPFLNQGREAIKKQMDEAKAFGVVIGADFARNADQFNDNMDRMRAMSQGFALEIANAVLPSLVRLTENLIAIGKAFSEIVGPALTVFASVMTKTAEQATSSWLGFFRMLVTPNVALADAAGETLAKSLTDPMKRALSDLTGDALKAALPQTKTELTDPEQAKKATAMLETLIQKYYELADAKLADFNAEMLRHQKQREDIDALLVAEQTKNQLLRQEEELHQASIDELRSKYHRKEQDRILAEQQERQRIQAVALRTGSQMFSDLAEAARVFGKKGFVAYKAFATAQAVIDTYASAIGAYRSVVSIPYIGPVLAVAAAAAAIAAGVARVAVIQSTNPAGYQAGGFTGSGPMTEVAGQVHRGEFVVPAPAVQRVGLPALEMIRAGELPESAAGAAVSVGGPNITNVSIRDHGELRDFLKSRAGRDEIINIVRDGRLELGFA